MDYAFLHGGAQGGWVWDELIAAMRLQRGGEFGRALALDVPGCGSKRARSTDGVTVELIAEELVADIEAAGFRDVVIVGHSQAGTVIPLLLALRPNLFRRAIYVSCVAPAQGKTVQTFREELYSPEQMAAPPRTANPAEIDALIRRYMCNDMDADEADAYMAKMGKDSWPPLSYAKSDWRYDAKGTCPATYVLTLRDAGVPIALQEIFAGRFNANTIVRIDSGHQPMNTRPQALAEIVLREAERGAP